MKIKRSDKSGAVAIELGPRETQIPVPEQRPRIDVLPIFHLKRILVPVDFSECSKKALVYAAALAKQFGAELTLLHIIPTYPVAPEMVTFEVNSSEYARKELEVLRLTIDNDLDCQTELQTGSPHLEIIRAAKRLGSDLIIISTHGHTGLTHVVLGSTCEKVIRQAPCPVLVVREKEREFLFVGTTKN
jgi:nucleotide-binding universal stress UspA family protein